MHRLLCAAHHLTHRLRRAAPAEGHTPISAEEATDPANLNAMLFLIGQMFADIYKADGQVCLGVHTGDAAAIVNFLYDFGLIPDRWVWQQWRQQRSRESEAANCECAGTGSPLA